jgi:predicted enzyme related to lactoylglutathione lyase
MEQALDFYCSKLGFKIKHTYDISCLVHLENEGPALIIEKTDKASPTRYPKEAQIVLGIETKNLKETVTELSVKGVRWMQDAPQEFPAGIFQTCKDPSGNIIEFLQFRQE